MSSNPSSTPISPEGMGGRSAFVLIMLLLGFGAFYWLSHDPNVLDAFSDLKREFDAPAPPAPVQPTPPAAPSDAPNTGTVPGGSDVQSEGERIRKEVEARVAQMEKDLAAAQREVEGDSPGSSPLVFVAEPTCAPIGRQWRVSGHVANTGHKTAAARKLKIALLIDGELSEEKIVEVGPWKPQGMQKYEALFRPDRNTRHHNVTATASWEK